MSTATKDLFPVNAPPPAPKERVSIDFYNMFMRERFGLPADWRWYRVESKGDGHKFTQFEGDVPCGVVTSGKNKGRTKWPNKKNSRTYFVTTVPHADVLAFISGWEKKTGLCSECDGTGQRWAGWSQSNGHTYRDCHKCAATGKRRA